MICNQQQLKDKPHMTLTERGTVIQKKFKLQNSLSKYLILAGSI